jgi:hypothetical protein
MLTVLLILAIAAFVCTIIAALGKCPIWIPVVLLCIIELLRQLPLGRTG